MPCFMTRSENRPSDDRRTGARVSSVSIRDSQAGPGRAFAPPPLPEWRSRIGAPGGALPEGRSRRGGPEGALRKAAPELSRESTGAGGGECTSYYWPETIVQLFA